MKYILGLDIGIASVGYGVINLDENKIELMGVRCFDKAEVPKTGESPALARRIARGARRTVRRRAERMQNLKYMLTERYNIISVSEYDNLFKMYDENSNPWYLRVKGLDEMLTDKELVRVLVHIAKHRGFKSNRKVVSDAKSDDGKSKKAIKENRELLQEMKYQTAGEMLYKDDKFRYRKRNTTGSYGNTLDREMLLAEADLILNKQKNFGNDKITEEFISDYKKIFSKQLPFARPGQIEKMIGHCTLEKEELRAPKMSYTAERFMLIQRINNLKYYYNGESFSLTEEEKEKIISKAYNTAKVTYIQIKKELNLPEDCRFKGITYTNKKEASETEKATFVELKGNNILKKAFGNLWVNISKDQKNIIANALTFYKDDKDIENYLKDNQFPCEYIPIVLNIPEFSKTANLSYKAMENLLPYMEEGYYYSDAVEKCGYTDESIEKHYKLPVIDMENLTNPVLKRSVSQVRKVVNAIIDKYGSPYKIHIELAREAGKSFKERQEIDKAIKENTVKNTNLRNEISKVYNGNISAKLLEKVKLYHEQNCKCAYSFEPIDYELLVNDDNAYQVDHILPYSRCFDNSSANKVLVLTSENQQKGNRTPYEYFGQDKERWEKFEAWINNNNIRQAKKNRLLNKTFGKNPETEKDFLERNKVDTQYICRFLKNLFENQLQFRDETYEDDIFGHIRKRRTVLCFHSQISANLRWLWGIHKKNRDNDMHHAEDALLIACATDSNLQNITKYLQDKEKNPLFKIDENGEVVKEKVPLPWENFNYEVNNYINEYFETITEDENKTKISSLAPDINDKNRIFVSRMPVHKATGELHEETIKGTIKDKEGNIEKITYRIALTKLKIGHFTEEIINGKKVKKLKMFNREQDLVLAELIEKRMGENNYDGAKAFAEPLYKPAGPNSKEPSHKVEKIKLCDNYTTGFEIPKVNGVADNAKMIRSDIFTKDGRFYIVPVYTWQIAKNKMPNKAIHGKTEKSWLEMTEEYKFLFSLYPYDLIHIKTNDENVFVYYRSVDRSDGRITYSLINNNSSQGRISIGKVVALSKFTVDILGNYHKVKREKREWRGE